MAMEPSPAAALTAGGSVEGRLPTKTLCSPSRSCSKTPSRRGARIALGGIHSCVEGEWSTCSHATTCTSSSPCHWVRSRNRRTLAATSPTGRPWISAAAKTLLPMAEAQRSRLRPTWAWRSASDRSSRANASGDRPIRVSTSQSGPRTDSTSWLKRCLSLAIQVTGGGGAATLTGAPVDRARD